MRKKLGNNDEDHSGILLIIETQFYKQIRKVAIIEQTFQVLIVMTSGAPDDTTPSDDETFGKYVLEIMKRLLRKSIHKS